MSIHYSYIDVIMKAAWKPFRVTFRFSMIECETGFFLHHKPEKAI